MKLCFAALALPLIAPQSDRTPVPDSAHEIVVEVGQVPMNGLWFQSAAGHFHDREFILGQVAKPDGSVDVTLTTGQRIAWSALTITFSHDASGATKVAAALKSRSDQRREGAPSTSENHDLEGRVLVQTNDWGPGKDISCMFELHARDHDQPVMLMGSFLVLLPKQG